MDEMDSQVHLLAHDKFDLVNKWLRFHFTLPRYGNNFGASAGNISCASGENGFPPKRFKKRDLQLNDITHFRSTYNCALEILAISQIPKGSL